MCIILMFPTHLFFPRFGKALQDVPNWLEEVAERALGTSYGPAGGKFSSRDTRQVNNCQMQQGLFSRSS